MKYCKKSISTCIKVTPILVAKSNKKCKIGNGINTSISVLLKKFTKNHTKFIVRLLIVLELFAIHTDVISWGNRIKIEMTLSVRPYIAFKPYG